MLENYIDTMTICKLWQEGFLFKEEEPKNEVLHQHLPFLIQTKPFLLDKKLLILLEKTKNKISLKKLPFNTIFIDCKFNYKSFEIYGILLIKLDKDRASPNELAFKINKLDIPKFKEDNIHIFFFGKDVVDETIFYKQIDLLGNFGYKHKDKREIFDYHILNSEKFGNYIRLLVCNFLDFLNTPDIELIEVERNEEKNKKRIKRGKIPLPSYNLVRVTGKLKIYLDKLNSGALFSYSHSFWVRGHFRTLRSEKWKNKQGTKIWIYPFIKGKGILVNKIYEAKQNGPNNT